MKHYALMVPGATPAAKRAEIRSPNDMQVFATADTGGAAVVEKALTTAYGLFRDRDKWIPVPKRIEVLHKAAEIMQKRFEELALLIAQEGGKPLIDARVEVARAIDGVKNCADLPRSHPGHVIPMNVNPASAGRMAFTQKEPIGVVVAVSAFNHPLNLIVHQVAPAVIAGCPVIVKPAADTPLSCFTFVQILRDAGYPDVWAQSLMTENREARRSWSRTSGRLLFIGSAAVG